jgi:uncharacterized membrane protein
MDAVQIFRRAAMGLAALALAAGAQAAPAVRYTITEIAAPGASWIEVTSVNSRGDVAGYARGPYPGVTFEVEQAFLWQNGTLTSLGFPSAVLNSRIFGMNDKGLLVGGVLGGDAYAWQDGTWTDLGFRGEARS